MDWFLYENGLRQQRVKQIAQRQSITDRYHHK